MPCENEDADFSAAVIDILERYGAKRFYGRCGKSASDAKSLVFRGDRGFSPESVIEQRKDSYYLGLRQTQGTLPNSQYRFSNCAANVAA